MTEVEILKDALRNVIISRDRVIRKIVDYDPAGSTYEMHWTEEVKRWANLLPCFVRTINAKAIQR